MLEEYGSVTQALLGTLFTWGMTAAGAALVIVIRGISQKVLLDISLGFAAGVMTAASYWSLLTPAIKFSEESGLYGEKGEYAFLPVAVGFLFGSIFVYCTDVFLDYLGINSTNMMIAMKLSSNNKVNLQMKRRLNMEKSTNEPCYPSITAVETQHFGDNTNNYHDRPMTSKSEEMVCESDDANIDRVIELRKSLWKRIVLLVVVITVHNIPEGLAIGVSFGAVGSSSTATFRAARNLAIGIGIQNFPEGLAVSLPLQAAGFSVWRSFWYGQLSGMVEPIFGVLGAIAVVAAKPVLPYALSFAAGAMIYVVIDDIIPEANTEGNGVLATWGCIVGFLVMMCLEVGMG